MVRNLESDPTMVLINVPQQLTAKSATALERQVDEAIVHKPGGITLNLSAVQTVDSAGLNWLLSLQKRLATHAMHLALQDPSPLIQDAFLATRLDSRFRFVHTAKEGEANHA